MLSVIVEMISTDSIAGQDHDAKAGNRSGSGQQDAIKDD